MLAREPQFNASGDDLRNNMRPPVGTADLNSKKDMRQLMKPPKGPDDLRKCLLNAQVQNDRFSKWLFFKIQILKIVL